MIRKRSQKSYGTDMEQFHDGSCSVTAKLVW